MNAKERKEAKASSEFAVFLFMLSLFLFCFLLFAQEQKDNKPPEDKPAIKKVGLEAKEKSEIENLIKKYFTAKSEDEKKQSLKDLEPYDHPSKADITSLSKLCFNLVKNGSKCSGDSPAKLNHPEYPGKYLITVPDSAKNKPTPLLIGLHGGGKGTGDFNNIPIMYGKALSSVNWITAFPEVIKKEFTAWNMEREERFVMELIEEIKRTYKVDTNKIYLSGHSMGGYGTWAIGGHYADVFAAINPNSGGIFVTNQKDGLQPGVVPNLKNTAIYFYHADGDKQTSVESDRRAERMLKELKEKYGPYDYIYKEIKANNHKGPGNIQQILTWMYEKKRNPYPKLVIWEPFRPYKKYFYWLKCDNVDGWGQRIEAKIEGNKIALKGSTAGVTVFLNEKLVDLTKPVILEVDGKEKFNGDVPYSIIALVETIDAHKDPEMYFVAKIK